MDPVVEDGEIRLRRPLAGAEDEGDVGKFLGDAAGDVLGGEGVAGDHLVAVAGEFAQHARVVGRGHALGPFVFDAELLLRLQQRLVDLVDPGLLDRRGEDRGDLHLLLRDGRARHERGGEERAASASRMKLAAIEPEACARSDDWIADICPS